MTSYFKGSAPYYLGELFTTSTELLTQLRDNLLTAGWLTQSDNIAGGVLVMRGQTSNGHNCWIRFVTSVISAGTQERLTLRGDLDGTGATLSGTGVWFDYKPGVNNYFFLTADNDSGCLCVFPDQNLPTRGGHFGFVNRIDPTDQWAWYVGDLYGANHSNKYVAKAKYDNEAWHQIGSAFLFNSEFENNGYSAYSQGPIQGTFDRYTVLSKPGYNFQTSSPWYGGDNAGIYAYNGKLNYNGLPVLDNYFYVEGRGTNAYLYARYPGSNSFTLYFRGEIKHAVTGVASLVAGTHVLTQDNQLFISSGSIGWQGFRIA